MTNFQIILSEYYLLIKSLHLIFVICWMAGLFYLPRLFVYHADSAIGSKQSETFKIMEYKLLKIIMNPAMMLTYIFGSMLLLITADHSAGWLQSKLVLVLILSGFHGFLAKQVKIFAQNSNTRKSKFFRWINEIPTVLMIVIVFLAVFK